MLNSSLIAPRRHYIHSYCPFPNWMFLAMSSSVNMCGLQLQDWIKQRWYKLSTEQKTYRQRKSWKWNLGILSISKNCKYQKRKRKADMCLFNRFWYLAETLTSILLVLQLYLTHCFISLYRPSYVNVNISPVNFIYGQTYRYSSLVFLQDCKCQKNAYTYLLKICTSVMNLFVSILP